MAGAAALRYHLLAIARMYGFPDCKSLDVEYSTSKGSIETAIYLTYVKGEYYQLKLEFQNKAPMYGWPVSQFALYKAVQRKGYEVEFEQVEYFDAGTLEELVDCIQKEKNKAPA